MVYHNKSKYVRQGQDLVITLNLHCGTNNPTTTQAQDLVITVG